MKIITAILYATGKIIYLIYFYFFNEPLSLCITQPIFSFGIYPKILPSKPNLFSTQSSTQIRVCFYANGTALSLTQTFL